MNKSEFVGGMQVRLVGTNQVMTLSGTPDDWICTWVENGKQVSQHFAPEDLEPA
ncbi:MAG TPA: hypothetical protein VGC30_12415 [Dokdonella sp.]